VRNFHLSALEPRGAYVIYRGRGGRHSEPSVEKEGVYMAAGTFESGLWLGFVWESAVFVR
jgi:hypothetical protein